MYSGAGKYERLRNECERYMLFNRDSWILKRGRDARSSFTKRPRSLISAHRGLDIHSLLHNTSQHGLYSERSTFWENRECGNMIFMISWSSAPQAVFVVLYVGMFKIGKLKAKRSIRKLWLLGITMVCDVEAEQDIFQWSLNKYLWCVCDENKSPDCENWFGNKRTLENKLGFRFRLTAVYHRLGFFFHAHTCCCCKRIALFI